jgi:hypothetical protein
VPEIVRGNKCRGTIRKKNLLIFRLVISVEDMRTFVSALDVAMETEVSGVCCCHLEAKVSEGQTNGHIHHWDHVLYMALLIVKVRENFV